MARNCASPDQCNCASNRVWFHSELSQGPLKHGQQRQRQRQQALDLRRKATNLIAPSAILSIELGLGTVLLLFDSRSHRLMQCMTPHKKEDLANNREKNTIERCQLPSVKVRPWQKRFPTSDRHHLRPCRGFVITEVGGNFANQEEHSSHCSLTFPSSNDKLGETRIVRRHKTLPRKKKRKFRIGVFVVGFQQNS